MPRNNVTGTVTGTVTAHRGDSTGAAANIGEVGQNVLGKEKVSIGYSCWSKTHT